MIPQFYLSYTEHMGFQELDGRAGYDFLLEAARIMRRPCYQIHSDSTKESDPLVDIIVITDEPMNHERAMGIDQGATNWLHRASSVSICTGITPLVLQTSTATFQPNFAIG